MFGVIHTWAIWSDEFFTCRRLLVTPCSEGYAKVPAEMGQAIVCSLEGYSVPGVHASQQAPLPSCCQFESSREESLWKIKYRRESLVVYMYSPSSQPGCSLDGLTLQRISLLFYKVADTMQLCPLGSGHFSLFLSFRLWVVVSLTFGVLLYAAFIESFNHFQSLLYKIAQT